MQSQPLSAKFVYTMLFIMVLIPFLLITALWIFGFFISNDFSVPTANISKYKNVLIIFPHADDEVLTTGGLIGALKSQGSKTTLVILTKGEKGTSNGEWQNDIKEIRVAEAKKASDIFGISTLIQEDFGDGELVNKREELTQYISNLLEKTKPDLVLTYDEAGLYGHEDHIVVSEVVTELVKSKYKTSELWYASFPTRVLNMMKLPEHMAKDPNFKNKRVSPNQKVFIAPHILNKVSAIGAYKSQIKSFEDGVPIKQLPLWFYHTMPFYEYFYKVDL